MANMLLISVMGIYCLGSYFQNPSDKIPGCGVTLQSYVYLLQEITEFLAEVPLDLAKLNSTRQPELFYVVFSLLKFAKNFEVTINGEIDKVVKRIDVLNTTQAPPLPQIHTTPGPTKPSDRAAIFTAKMCEGGSTTLTCDNGTTINIIAANYSAYNSSLCGNLRSVYATNNCTTKTNSTGIPWPRKYAMESCQGKSSCVLYESNIFLQDPCGGAFKFYSVAYGCIMKA